MDNEIQVANSSGYNNTELAISRFKEDSECQVLLLSEQSSAGLDLSHASQAIILSPFTSISNMTQFFARVHRIGQKSNVDLYMMVTSNSIEDGIYKKVKSNEEIIDKFYKGVQVDSQVLSNALAEIDPSSINLRSNALLAGSSSGAQKTTREAADFSSLHQSGVFKVSSSVPSGASVASVASLGAHSMDAVSDAGPADASYSNADSKRSCDSSFNSGIPFKKPRSGNF